MKYSYSKHNEKKFTVTKSEKNVVDRKLIIRN